MHTAPITRDQLPFPGEISSQIFRDSDGTWVALVLQRDNTPERIAIGDDEDVLAFRKLLCQGASRDFVVPTHSPRQPQRIGQIEFGLPRRHFHLHTPHNPFPLEIYEAGAFWPLISLSTQTAIDFIVSIDEVLSAENENIDNPCQNEPACRTIAGPVLDDDIAIIETNPGTSHARQALGRLSATIREAGRYLGAGRSLDDEAYELAEIVAEAESVPHLNPTPTTAEPIFKRIAAWSKANSVFLGRRIHAYV